MINGNDGGWWAGEKKQKIDGKMKKDFNRYLKSLDAKSLSNELKKLYDKFDLVRKYYEIELGQNSDAIVKEYKHKIKKEYFPTRGYGAARSSVSKKIISEFRKVSVHNSDVVELLLYRTEMMLEYTLAYGDIDEAFYNSLCSSFSQACKIISKDALQEYYRDYCLRLISMSEGFGWGVYYDLSEEYKQCFNPQ